VASSALLLTGEQVAGIRRRRGFDVSMAVFALLALCLALLVVMPTGWLLWYSVTNDQGQLAFGNWLALVTDPSLRAAMGARTFRARCPLLPDWEDNSWARGAAALVTQKLFDFEMSGGTVAGTEIV